MDIDCYLVAFFGKESLGLFVVLIFDLRYKYLLIEGVLPKYISFDESFDFIL